MLNQLKNINELVMFKHTIFSMPFIFIAIFVEQYHIDGSILIGWKVFFLAVLATISARNFAMSFNRYIDAKHDALNPRTKNRPSVDGRISKFNMILFMSINALVFVIVAYFINITAFFLSVPVLCFLGFYSFVKRFSYLAHIVLGITLGLAPLAGVIAVSGSINLWSIFLSLGVIFWVAGFDLLYSLQDEAFDKKHGLHSIPAKFGVHKTLLISLIFHVFTSIFWALFIYQASLGIFAIIGTIISVIILICEHLIVRKGLKQINKAFFTLNGYLGIIFFIFILTEIGIK
ncbi:MAG: Menaquinone via futalosine polyprenyltransferase (MenA homolog) [uncultured Campylobacterales bacterium]|uniref:4-hydroxybenzoate polyprenyltransferase n=1 Tax=uncultured Campylobacterales bacterium TaxID=352960 RepID=A0A6S6SZB5_9BACT|nr:MAG: Menaquinone via futalosine polyprenyltransferase (MenA homolog) [uncultured Campylobacterales bacterium]